MPANNLQGSNFKSNWNVYAYNISVAVPNNAKGQPYFPDYMRFGTWSDGFYVAWDLLDAQSIVGFEVCQLDKADMIAGLSSTSPICYTYIPTYLGAGNNNSLTLLCCGPTLKAPTPSQAIPLGSTFLPR